MSPSQPAPDVAVVAAYQQRTQALRVQVAAIIERIWNSLGEYREPQLNTFVKQVVPLVLAGQKQMSALTVGYHQAQRNAVVGRTLTLRVDPSKVSGQAARNGVDPAEVYGRPVHLVWRQLAELPHEPGSIEAAIQSGLNRAIDTALTDLQLTKVQTSQLAGEQDSKVRWMQRVLEGPHSCGLCIVASTLTYHNGKTLLPIHPACDCSVRFGYGDQYPDHILDPETLADVHETVADRFGRSSPGARTIPGARNDKNQLIQYRDVLITHEHGELGPVLGVRGASFLGPDDI